MWTKDQVQIFNTLPMVPLPQTAMWKYVAVTSIAIALVASYVAYSYRERWRESKPALNKLIGQNEQMVQEYEVVNQKLDKIRKDLSIMESTAFTKVVMKGTANDLKARASVYWNASTHEAYISIQNLKDISPENQFQLWAIVKGKTVDVGVFEKNFTGLLKMKNVEGATAFAVTIEPRGGKEIPTMETMQVIGPLPLRDG